MVNPARQWAQLTTGTFPSCQRMYLLYFQPCIIVSVLPTVFLQKTMLFSNKELIFLLYTHATFNTTYMLLLV